MTDDAKRDYDYICSLCGGKFKGFGNNAMPLKADRCCDACNESKVIPARIRALMHNDFAEVK